MKQSDTAADLHMLENVLDNILEKPGFSNQSTACQNVKCDNPVKQGFCQNCAAKKEEKPLALDTSMQSVDSFMKKKKKALTKGESQVLKTWRDNLAGGK